MVYNNGYNSYANVGIKVSDFLSISKIYLYFCCIFGEISNFNPIQLEKNHDFRYCKGT